MVAKRLIMVANISIKMFQNCYTFFVWYFSTLRCEFLDYHLYYMFSNCLEEMDLRLIIKDINLDFHERSETKLDESSAKPLHQWRTIYNCNIKGISFYKGGLHLLDRGQNILSNKFIFSLKNCENSYATHYCHRPRRKQKAMALWLIWNYCTMKDWSFCMSPF